MAALKLQQQEDTSLAVLDLVVWLISSVYTLAHLSAVNKRCKDLCALQATQQLQKLLLPALQQVAAVPESPLYLQHSRYIRWLCSVADREAFAAASAAVLAVPNVSALTVYSLAEAGVRVSDVAVMAAALKEQPGAELWLETMNLVSGREETPLARVMEQLCTGTGALHRKAAAAPAPEAALMQLFVQSRRRYVERVGGNRGYYKATVCCSASA
jgi:hypothetical protein